IGADLPRRLGDRGRGAAVELYQLEGLDLLRLAVFRHVEISRLQIGKLIAVAVGDDDVHADEINAAAEHGLLRIRRRRRLLWLLLSRRLGLPLLLALCLLLLSLSVTDDAQQDEARRTRQNGSDRTTH